MLQGYDMKSEAEKQNQRSMKTKIRLANGLAEMMKEERLSRISVSALCERCCVSRATFYNNFSSIREVAEFYVKQHFLAVEKALKSNKKMTLREQYEYMIHYMITTSYATNHFIVDIIGKVNRPEVYNIMFLFLEKQIESFLMQNEELAKDSSKRKLLAYSWAGSLTGLISFVSNNRSLFTAEDLEETIKSESSHYLA